MDHEPDRQLIAELVANAATRVDAGPRQLVARCGSDHFNAIAVEWLRRWRPETTVVVLPPCCCPGARCEACN